MELAEGMTLKRYIRRYGRLSARETVDFAIQITSGLQAAHEHHIIHRDIKPQNILVSDSGTIKVTDFELPEQQLGMIRFLPVRWDLCATFRRSRQGRLRRRKKRYLFSGNYYL